MRHIHQSQLLTGTRIMAGEINHGMLVDNHPHVYPFMTAFIC